MREREGKVFFKIHSKTPLQITFINPAITIENFCLSERLVDGFYKPVRRWQLTKNSPAAGSHKWEGETVKGNKTNTHTHTHPSGDFISLPVISRLNNSGQGITSARLDGSEQQSHTGGK